MSLKIFISYRRQDSGANALGIGQYLEKAFGRKNVFIDVDMRAGTKFPQMLEERLAECKVMLVLIGSDWLNAADEQGRRRLDDPDDWVRLEIAHALNRNITVIPVSVNAAQLPTRAKLPNDIQGLLDHQAVSVTLAGFRSEMSRLVRDIRASTQANAADRNHRKVVAVAAKAEPPSAALAPNALVLGAVFPVLPHQDIRVAMCALIRIASGDRYVLIRNLHRPESFAPIGGVYKYFKGGRAKLDTLEFRPQEINSDMTNDVRGFLPYKNLDEFINWFDKGDGRESAQECLQRELGEELAEAGLEPESAELSGVQFSFVRTVREGPEAIAAESYIQFRIFDIYDMVVESAREHNLLLKIQAHATIGKDLCWATSNEIIRGRSRSSHIIGAHTPYLFGQTRYRPQDPAPW
jgi:hypothetical protein